MFLLIPENKMTENDHDRSFNLPFQKVKSPSSMMGRMKRLLRPKPVIYEDLKLSSFKRLKVRPL